MFYYVILRILWSCVDLKIVELEGKQDEINTMTKSIERLSANQARMNMEMQQMTDEVDLARDTSRRLSQVDVHYNVIWANLISTYACIRMLTLQISTLG